VSWSRQLSKTIELKDGRVLHTLVDAAELLISFGDAIQAHAWIERAAELIMTAAESEDQEEIRAATNSDRAALFREGML
jgi:hypothetical protein